MSSQDFHPTSGARFIFSRLSGEDEQACYQVDVYLAGGARWQGTLTWSEGQAVLLEAETQTPIDKLAWVQQGVLAQARVLKKTAKKKLIRWREE